MARERLDGFAVGLLTLLCAFWGLQQVAIKIAVLDGLPPALQAGLRSVISTILLCLWVGLRGGRMALGHLFLPDRALRPGAVLALVFAGEFLLVYYGLQRTTASRGVLFLYTAPFFVALGVHLFVPEERLGPRQTLGLVSAFAGVMVAVADGLRHGGGGTLLGDAMVGAGAVLWATLTVMVKASPVLRATRPAKLLLYQLAGSAPILLGVAWFAGEWPEIAHTGALAYAALAYQAVVVAFATYLTWYWLILHYPAGRLAAFSFLTPLFGMLAGWAFLSEPISPALALALVFVAAGLYLVNGRARPKPPAGVGVVSYGLYADPDTPAHRGGIRQDRL